MKKKEAIYSCHSCRFYEKKVCIWPKLLLPSFGIPVWLDAYLEKMGYDRKGKKMYRVPAKCNAWEIIL